VGIGVSLILIAVGAILTWAVNTEVSGVDIQTIGVILLIVGIAGALLSLVFWSSWGGPAGVSRRRTTYVEDGPYQP
jgi:hypothetical protein